jgi:hypothetical protein
MQGQNVAQQPEKTGFQKKQKRWADRVGRRTKPRHGAAVQQAIAPIAQPVRSDLAIQRILVPARSDHRCGRLLFRTEEKKEHQKLTKEARAWLREKRTRGGELTGSRLFSGGMLERSSV